VATVGAASLIVPVAAVPEGCKVFVIFINRISSCWYTHSSRSSTQVRLLFASGSVISTSSSSIGECKGIRCIHRRVAQAEFKHSRTSVAEAGVIVATVEPHHYH
jgi:hypothetical protein